MLVRVMLAERVRRLRSGVAKEGEGGAKWTPLETWEGGLGEGELILVLFKG